MESVAAERKLILMRQLSLKLRNGRDVHTSLTLNLERGRRPEHARKAAKEEVTNPLSRDRGEHRRDDRDGAARATCRYRRRGRIPRLARRAMGHGGHARRERRHMARTQSALRPRPSDA